MAARHVSREFIVRIDLEDFFGSITFPRVLGALKTFPLNIFHSWAAIIAQLCTCDGVLPQGAPTSPAISNLIARRMDGELIRFAKEHGFRYSRYSDDLVFSGKTRRNLSALVEVDKDTYSYVAAEPIRSIVESNGFHINNAKTKVAFRKQKQVVVGAIVNKKVNVDRKYVRQIRTLLHLARKSTKDALEAHQKWSGRKRSKSISKVIRGKIEYIRTLKGSSDSVFVSLAESFNGVFAGEKPIEIMHKLESKADGYTEKDVLVCSAFHKTYGDPRGGGDDNSTLYKTGSCFFLEGVGLVTSFHTLFHNFKVFLATNPVLDFDIQNALFCDSKRDIAILDGSPVFEGLYRTLKPETARETAVGEGVTMLGYPNYVEGDLLSRKSGKITQCKERFGMTLYAVDIGINEGESGGPVVNDRGRVVGIARSYASDQFVVPIKYVLESAMSRHSPKILSNWESEFVDIGGVTSGSSMSETHSVSWAAVARFLRSLVRKLS